MPAKPNRFLRIWIVTAITAVTAWSLLPGTSTERVVFALIARHHAALPHTIGGQGSHQAPWTVASESHIIHTPHSPVVVALKDNADGIFQSSPHAPIDFAVIFNNVQRLGAQRAACAALLAWERPDPIGLTALESTMGEFESLVIAVPLTRGAMMDTMPPAFRRASLHIEDIQGETGTLPLVNRVSIPDMIYGGDNVLAGFQIIDSEPAANPAPILARWDYRVVFSFPLVAAMQQLKLKPDDLIIHAGSHIQLGPKGPKIPIDEFGRPTITARNIKPSLSMDAAELIDADPTKLGDHPFQNVVIHDSRSHADMATANFNRATPSCILMLTGTPQTAEKKSYPRLSGSQEMFTLLALALILAMLAQLGGLTRIMITVLLTAATIMLQFEAFDHAEHWLPGSQAIATILAASIAYMIFARPRRKTTPMPRLERIDFS